MLQNYTPEMPPRMNRNLYYILLDQAQANSESVYLCGHKGSLSYRQAQVISTKIAHHLRRNGRFLQQPIIAANIRNSEHLLFLIWACLASGICLAFLPPSRDPRQMCLFMKQVDASDLVTDMPDLFDMSLPVPFDDFVSVDTSTQSLVDDSVLILDTKPTMPAFIFQTSGTTGEPKWVQVTHGQFQVAIECLQQARGLSHAINQVVYITPPLSHSYGLSSLLEYTLCGSTVVLPSGASPMGPVGELINIAVANHITAIEGVPYFYSQLSKLINRIDFSSLRHIGFGGGALNLDFLECAQSLCPKLTYSVRYGMTETPSVVSHKLFSPPYNGNVQSSGKVLPIYDLQIVDEAGRGLPAGQEGEIQIKGECLALPYYGESKGDEAYFATGDVGYINHDHELVVVGRKSFFIKNRGYRISPEYVESIVCTFNCVCDCRVSMRDSKLVAEVACAESDFSAQALLSFLSDRLPDYAIPDVITFAESIPRTLSGKIKRY